MPPEPSGETESKSAAEHLRRALDHALDGLRCYVAALAADVQQRVSSTVRRAVLTVALLVLALFGAILFLSGLARCLDWCVGAPGAGPMIIGGAVLVAVLIVLVASRRGGHK